MTGKSDTQTPESGNAMDRGLDRRRGGGSARRTRPRLEGGGYPDICTDLKFENADDLIEPWRSVAKAVGWDTWCVIWGILLSSDRIDDRGRVRAMLATLPLCAHRDRTIDALTAAGVSVHDQVDLMTAMFDGVWERKTIANRIKRRMSDRP